MAVLHGTTIVPVRLVQGTVLGAATTVSTVPLDRSRLVKSPWQQTFQSEWNVPETAICGLSMHLVLVEW
jgi:hypothetical protein